MQPPGRGRGHALLVIADLCKLQDFGRHLRMQQRQPNAYKADHREKKVICQIINAIFFANPGSNDTARIW